MHLKYLNKQRRVRLTLTKEDTMSYEQPPAKILEMAKQKMQREVQAGNVAFYRVFETRLAKIWQTLRNSWSESQTKLHVTLAAGAPKLVGLSIQLDPSAEYVCKVSVQAQLDQIRDWSFPFFKVTVGKLTRDGGNLTEIPDAAQLYQIWLLARSGNIVDNIPVKAINKIETVGNKNFEIQTDNDLGYAKIIINNVCSLQDPTEWANLRDQIALAAQELRENTHLDVKILMPNLIKHLQSALRGPERFGMDLPMTHLVATNVFSQIRNNKMLSSGSIAKSVPTKTTGNDIEFSISEDRMQATISRFSPAVYNQRNFSIQNLIHAARKQGIEFGFNGAHANILYDKIAKKESLDGLVVAVGQKGAHPEEPYLELMTYDVTNESGGDIYGHYREMVYEGDVFARVAYGNPGRPVIDVLGSQTFLPYKGEFHVDVGEYIERTEDDRFFALTDGYPELNENSLKLYRTLVIAGDYTRSQGVLRFDGNIEIKGNVLEGAEIYASRSINVSGGVEGAVVQAGADLTVGGGVITTEFGKVIVGGNLNAKFIEISNVTVDGDVLVLRGILNSHVRVRGNLTLMEKDSSIIGGELHIGGLLVTSNLGAKHRTRTKVTCGYDWALAQRRATVSRRINALKNLRKDLTNQGHSIGAGSQRFRKAKHKSEEDVLAQTSRLISVNKRQIEGLDEQIIKQTQSADVLCIIREELTPFVDFSVGLNEFAVESSLTMVKILSRKSRNGVFFASLNNEDLQKVS